MPHSRDTGSLAKLPVDCEEVGTTLVMQFRAVMPIPDATHVPMSINTMSVNGRAEVKTELHAAAAAL